MLETFADRLGRETNMPVRLGTDGMRIVEGEVYLAPGAVHMEVSSIGFKIRLVAGPPVNYVCPAADPLFRSGAQAFGPHSVGVIMTGMGRDGSDGAAELRAAGGAVLVQDPSTSTATSMPASAIEMGAASEVVPLDDLAASISDHAKAKALKLRARITR